MISLSTLFWLLVIVSGLLGMMRGWTKEVIATSGIILSLFILELLGFRLSEMLGLNVANISDNNPAVIATRQKQFFFLSLIHIFIVFFSYQGPTLAGKGLAGRLRVRDGVQDKLMGFFTGGINGYLTIGMLWSLLEYQLTANEVVRLPPGVAYPFDPSVIIRPEITDAAQTIVNYLPLPLLGPYALYLMIAAFLFVIIVMI